VSEEFTNIAKRYWKEAGIAECTAATALATATAINTFFFLSTTRTEVN
jgi:hypothetical protein